MAPIRVTPAPVEAMPPGFRGIPNKAGRKVSKAIKAPSVRAVAKAASVKAAAVVDVVMVVTISDTVAIRGSATIRAAAAADRAVEVIAVTTNKGVIIKVAARAATKATRAT